MELKEIQGKEAVLYEKEKGKIKCLACAHKCLIAKNNFGICGVRKNINGKLFLLVYGKLCSVNIDPIEKKPLYHFLPGSRAFSIGTVGCNFKCDFCQNWEISQASKGEENERKIFGKNYTANQIVKMAIKTKCESIAYTYNEPAIFIEFVRDVARIARKKGIKNILVTNGYLSKESFDFIYKYIDAMNIDLKGDDEFYKKYCGASLKPVLETIKRAHKKRIHVEITTLLIPELNDFNEKLEKIAKFIAKVDRKIPWHISRFFPMYKMQDKRETSNESLKRAYTIGKKYLDKVYLGNL